jgi:hypothetical protein
VLAHRSFEVNSQDLSSYHQTPLDLVPILAHVFDSVNRPWY